MKIVKGRYEYEINNNSKNEYKRNFFNFLGVYFIILFLLVTKHYININFIVINAIILWFFTLIIHQKNLYLGFDILFKIFLFNKYDFIRKHAYYKILEEEFQIYK